METKKSLAYLRARKKVETLKGFYKHLLVYVLINILIILINANVFNNKPIDFLNWTNYLTAFFWGIGLLCHAIHVFFLMNFKYNFLKCWEEKKIREILENDV